MIEKHDSTFHITMTHNNVHDPTINRTRSYTTCNPIMIFKFTINFANLWPRLYFCNNEMSVSSLLHVCSWTFIIMWPCMPRHQGQQLLVQEWRCLVYIFIKYNTFLWHMHATTISFKSLFITSLCLFFLVVNFNLSRNYQLWQGKNIPHFQPGLGVKVRLSAHRNIYTVLISRLLCHQSWFTHLSNN